MSTEYPLLLEVEPARPGTGDQPTVGPTYRNVVAKEGFPTLDGVTTLYELFSGSVKKFAQQPCLGFRRIVNGVAQAYEFMTYHEVSKRVADVASGYRALGMEAGSKIGICGSNSPEWMIGMQGCNRNSMVCVPLYETLGDNAIEYIIDHSESKLVLTAANRLPLLAKALPKLQSPLTALVYWGEADPKQIEAAKQHCQVLSFQELQQLGKGKPADPVPPKPADICTILYTSGTTGAPKGVLLSHANIVGTIAGCQQILELANEQMGPGDVFFSFLTLAHAFGRMVEEFFLNQGGAIGYWQGDVHKLNDDLMALRPTFFAAVPRVLDRVYSGVEAKVKEGGVVAQSIYSFAYHRKLHFLKEGWRPEHASPLADQLVFSKLKARLGGRVRIILAGAAPLSTHVEEFLKVAMCAPMIQGYGLTETCAASFIAQPFKFEQIGSVGPPMGHTEVRLEAVPEMSYDPLARPQRGEVCIRGPGVFQGYYKDEEKTRECMDADGFFHTGDIGEITGEGVLRIIDRKKNIFKLSQGEYVAVEKLEAVYKKCPLVEELWVYGNSYEPQLVAVVVPARKVLMAWAEANGITGDFEEVCGKVEVRQYVQQQMSTVGRAGGLKGFEDVKAVYLEPKAFSVEAGQLTPSFKLKRGPLLEYYKAQVDEMYAQLKSRAKKE